MEGEGSPKIETEAEGMKEVDQNSKQREGQDDVLEETIGADDKDAKEEEVKLNNQDPQQESQDEDQKDETENDESHDKSEGNDEEEDKQEEEPHRNDLEEEKHPQQLDDNNGGNDGNIRESMMIPNTPPEEEDNQDPMEGSHRNEEYSDGNEVYDKHQIEGPQYDRDLEGEYQYGERDDEETKRLDDEDNEDQFSGRIHPDNYEEEEEEEEDLMQSKIRAIIELCHQNEGKYGDTDFSPNDASLYKNPAEPPDYAENTPVVEWKRPEEALKSGNEDEIKMISQGMTSGDVKQGTLGDCWLLGAFLILATRPHLLQNLIVKDGIKYGFAVFQFFKNGEWQQVLVDTRLPYNREIKTPLYGHCADPTEVWVPLMEKAYAKLHKNYENLNGGSLAEALVDLTGGVSEKIYLHTEEVKDAMENGQLWKELRKYFQAGYLLGCANNKIDEDGNQEEGAGNQGIQYNHAYGIMDIRVAQGIQLIRIRNPWGYGEWTGRFADEDEAWDDAKGLKEELNYDFNPDGTWWMRYDDWYNNYNRVYVCKVFPQNWEQYSIIRNWEGNSAGGPYPPDVDRDETTGVHTQLDTNDKWFNNPQFRLSVYKKTQVYISLMQEDEKISKKAYIPVNFLVVRVKSKKQRLWEVDKDDIVLEAAKGHQRFGQREICMT